LQCNFGVTCSSPTKAPGDTLGSRIIRRIGRELVRSAACSVRAADHPVGICMVVRGRGLCCPQLPWSPQWTPQLDGNVSIVLFLLVSRTRRSASAINFISACKSRRVRGSHEDLAIFPRTGSTYPRASTARATRSPCRSVSLDPTRPAAASSPYMHD
jgi:hypothetical protein